MVVLTWETERSKETQKCEYEELKALLVEDPLQTQKFAQSLNVIDQPSRNLKAIGMIQKQINWVWDEI